MLAQFFFHQRLTDLASMAALRTELADCQQLNRTVQAFLRQWSGRSERRNPPVMLDQAAMPWFAELNRSLNDTLDDDAFRERIRHSRQQLRQLAAQILAQATGEHPGLDDAALRGLVGDVVVEGEWMLPGAAVEVVV
ncbi:MAG: hypothetical protein MUF55_13670 [Hydrogenophaga sp.]|nr:hypothetical protein [Hydrogenophaga sp.]